MPRIAQHIGGMDVRKRIASVILALLIFVSALPVGSLAAPADSGTAETRFGNFSTTGIDLTDWSADSGGTFTCTDGSNGTISWDDNKILTLTNVKIGVSAGSSAIKFSDQTKTNYTLVLEGTNTITTDGYGIRMLTAGGSLTIRGEGSLDITVNTGTSVDPICGIGAGDGDIIFESGAVAIHMNGSSGGGVVTENGNILVKDGFLTVDDRGTEGKERGLYSHYGVVRITGGNVDIRTRGTAIEGGAVRIDGGTVTAETLTDTNKAVYTTTSSSCDRHPYAEEGFHIYIPESSEVTPSTASIVDTAYSDITVTAYWGEMPAEPSKYTVTLNDLGTLAGGESSGAGQYAAGTTVTLNAGSKPGYTFKEWAAVQGSLPSNADSTNSCISFQLPPEDLILKAVWEAVPARTITLYHQSSVLSADLGTQVWPATYRAGETVSLNLTMNEYTFNRCRVSGNKITTNPVSFTMPDYDLHITVIWDPVLYHLTVNNLGTLETGQKDANGDYAKGSGVLLYAGTKEGCTFKGWTTGSEDITINGKSPATFKMPGHDVTVTAVWEGEPTPVTYPVAVTGAGADAAGAGSYAAGQGVTVTAGTRAGCTFAGWMAEGVALGSPISNPTASFAMPAGAVSLRACWTPNPVDGVTTLYLDDLPGAVTIDYEGYTCENEGSVRHAFYGKSYILTQRNPGTPTANTVTVASPSGAAQEFDITLKDVNIAGADRAAFRAGYPVHVRLTLEGGSTLQGGANHAGLEMASDTGYEQTAVTIQGQGSLTAVGGTGGAGIGGSLGDNFGEIRIAGGTVTARGGAGAAGIGGGSCYANGGTGAGCANSTGNAVYITGGTVSATAGATTGSLRGAAGIGAGEGAGVNTSQSGGPYVSVRISGGDTTAQGAGQAPAIGGTYVGNIRITGGTVTTAANPNCTTEIGTCPGVTAGSVRQVRLADDSTGQGNAVVFVTKAGVIDDTPASAYAGDNYNWNGIVYAGGAGQLYVGVNAKTNIVEWESLTVPAGKTLNIPRGVTVKLPEDAAVSGGQLAGDGHVQLGEVLHYIKDDGTLAPCEVEYTGNNTPRVFDTLEELLTTWSAYLTTSNNHIRLLADVAYPADLAFTHCTEAELDLNGHTLHMGTHRINAAMEQNLSVSALLTISDSSAEKTGKITGDSAEALVYSPDGCLAVSGGTFTNTGTGPAVEFGATREGSGGLTGGTFSRIQISAAQGSGPKPLTGLLGSGLAFYDSAAEVWISPASEKAALDGVSVLAKSLPALTADHAAGSSEVSVGGLSGSAACQWLYNREEGDPAAALEGAVGPVLYLNDGTLPGDGYVSCRVTADGVTILTDPVFVNAEAPALLITVMAGASEIYDGKPHTPAVIVSAGDGKPLGEGTDYVLSYENNTAAGQAFAVVTLPEGGSRHFSGTVRKGFVISKAPLRVQAADQTVQQISAVQSGPAMARAEGLAAGDVLAGVTVAASGQETVPSAARIQNAAGEDVSGCYEIVYRSGTLTVTGGGSGDPDPGPDVPDPGPDVPDLGSGGNGGGSSDGGGDGGDDVSGSSGNAGSTATRNPDGSVTTTQTNRATGAVAETTRHPDGSVTTVVTARDGTVTTTEKNGDAQTTTVERPDGTSTVTARAADGTTARTETGAGGQSASTVTVSRQAAEAAGDGPVALPLPALQAGRDPDRAPEVTVQVSGGGTVRAEIPVSNVTAGTVAVLVRPDGSRQVLKRTLPGEGGIVFPAESGATVKIVDNARDFADVPGDHWAAASVDFVTSRELFLGTGGSAFSPDRTVTRGMLMTVLARLDGQDTASAGDVWYASGMNWAVAREISDGSAPEANISREQLVVMLYRYAGSPTPPDLPLDFADADQVGGYAGDAMRWAASQGILRGKTGGLLDPKGPATRAQVARMLENYLKVLYG